MSLTKKAQWIVWDGRKNGIDAETILARCEEKGVSDSREDLLKAITARPYKAQPTRVYNATQATKGLDGLKNLIAQVVDPEQRAQFEALLAQKVADAKAKAEAEAQAAIVNRIAEALKGF